LIFRILLLMSAFNIPITSTAADLGQIFLKKNEVAPFSGLLTPDYIDKKMHIDILFGKACEKELKHCIIDNEKLKEEVNREKKMWFLNGLGDGIFLTTFTILLSHKYTLWTK